VEEPFFFWKVEELYLINSPPERARLVHSGPIVRQKLSRCGRSKAWYQAMGRSYSFTSAENLEDQNVGWACPWQAQSRATAEGPDSRFKKQNILDFLFLPFSFQTKHSRIFSKKSFCRMEAQSFVSTSSTQVYFVEWSVYKISLTHMNKSTSEIRWFLLGSSYLWWYWWLPWRGHHLDVDHQWKTNLWSLSAREEGAPRYSPWGL
jgi:hypothetical protein